MDRVVLKPNLGAKARVFSAFARDLQREVSDQPFKAALDVVRQRRNRQDRARSRYSGPYGLRLYLVENIVLDLLAARWQLDVAGSEVAVCPPNSVADGGGQDAKESIRASLIGQRDVQLRSPSVRRFVKDMEAKRLTVQGWQSITSLIRDGRELADSLEALPSANGSFLDSSKKAIDPYIQFVERGERCAFTGFLLTDVWRYFRHTWVTPYRSLPGRNISILIRDAAVDSHPVIGIAALGSSIVQQDIRDRVIGWHPDSVKEWVKENPTNRVVSWLTDQLRALIASIYVQDILAEKLITTRSLTRPEKSDIERLRQSAKSWKAKHQKLASRREHKTLASENRPDWKKAAESDLFSAKRREELASLLAIKSVFQASGFDCAKSADAIAEALSRSDVSKAVKALALRMKASRVGINIMDITVCGAIAPYNAILGGKLVSMLMASPEVSRYYRKKYRARASVIASSMKGAEVYRNPRLAFLGTTSLYGVGSSQYNRIVIPATIFGRDQGTDIRYRKLGVSEGYGTVHFSQRTIRGITTALSRSQDGLRVNSIFGEGVNPLLRKIREGLNLLGLPANDLLNHRSARIVYGVSLLENSKEFLLGLTEKPRFLIPQDRPRYRTEQIVDYWRSRWLHKRIERQTVLEQMRENHLEYPLSHDALVSREIDDMQEEFELVS